MIHKNYDTLTPTQKLFVDELFGSNTFKRGRELCGYSLLGCDSVERAVEAVATWVKDSEEDLGL
jgi:hypothetical protein